jgi:hypothetical protein
VAALAAGLVLRALWVVFFADLDGDSEIFGTIAKNMIAHHQYALDDPYHLTLIRVPGYPVFMAAVFLLFGMKNYCAVRWAQVLVDMGTCALVGAFARDHAGPRVGLAALWIACLCPFTANYVAIPLTECPSLFAIALGLFAAGRLVRAINAGGKQLRWTLVTAAALIAAVELRPDGGLLAAVIAPGVVWYTRKRNWRAGMRAAAVCAALMALPIALWTARNWRVFHVFQPLAPRSAMDPSETPLEGFNRWTTTWEAEYVALPEVWWKGDSLIIDMKDLPARAFDSEAEYRETARLIADYNRGCIVAPEREFCTITPDLDRRFAALAEQRAHRHPLRQFVVLPLTRLADMWLRPRTEYLDILPLRWWEWREHPGGSAIAAGFAALNLLLLIFAAVGFARGRAPFAGMLMAYIALRCAVLLTLPNAEPRYTLECFPMVMVAAACCAKPTARRS